MTEKWYHNVPELMTQTDKLYERLIALGKPDKFALTKEKIYSERNWEPARSYIEKNFDEQLRRLGYFYIPKVFQPGPTFVFPFTDAAGIVHSAQTRPMPGSDLYYVDQQGKVRKYYWIGYKEQFLGPTWAGNDAIEVAKILKQRRVVLTEGAFDLLACRLLRSDLPTLSPLSKKAGNRHVDYLRMLGVETLYLLYDYEKSEAGQVAMRLQQLDLSKYFDVRVLEMAGGGDDPSSALKNVLSLRSLQQLLESI